MHELISKYITGEITVEERDKLFDVVKKDTVVHDEFIRALNLCGLISWLPEKNDVSDSISKLAQLKRRVSNKKKFSLKHLYKYAAVACIAIIAVSFIFNSLYNKSDLAELSNIVYKTISVPAGQRMHVKLQDGTMIWLNSKSTLKYPDKFSSAERLVELDGEGYFCVAKNKKCPFIVRTEKVSIKVLGTKFNVFAYKKSSEFSTALLEGSVKLYKNGNESCGLMMSPHDKVTMIKGQFVKEHFDGDDIISWKDGVYTFNGERFDEIARRLELYYGIPIIVKDSSLNGFLFSGKFRQADSVESILGVMQKLYPFKYTMDKANHRIVIN